MRHDKGKIRLRQAEGHIIELISEDDLHNSILKLKTPNPNGLGVLYSIRQNKVPSKVI